MLRRGIPFELAEPGTDPTRIPNSVSRRSLRLGDYWIVLVVVGFLAFGYVRFVRKPTSPKAEIARPVPTAPPTLTSTPGIDGDSAGSGFFGGDNPGDNPAANFARGFFPIEESATPALTSTSTPISIPTSTPTATLDASSESVIVYGVFVGDLLNRRQIICRCWPDGTVEGASECGEAIPAGCWGSSDE